MKKVIKTVALIILTIIVAVIMIFAIMTAINRYKMSHMTLEERLDSVYAGFEKDMRSGGMTYQVEKADCTFTWSMETGDLAGNRQYALASITKLYTATVMFKLADDGIISLDDTIDKYLDDSIVDGIHVYKGVDYSHKIIIRQLLSHSSGLPDYYTESSREYKAIAEDFALDKAFSFDDILVRTKALTPHFVPGEKGEAYYSDFNFDLLKVVIENTTGKSLEENYREYIYEPLDLKKTYLFAKNMKFEIPGIWFDGRIYVFPNILASSGASGGLIANRTENMIFLKGFMEGRLFESSHFDEMKNYNYLQFYPMQYGMGMMRFAYFGVAEIIGHSGSTGTLCYYCPKYDVYITGAINEQNESKGIQQVCKLVNCFAYEK
jgi:D-alanyl-D-alanine carboxypeptidase